MKWSTDGLTDVCWMFMFCFPVSRCDGTRVVGQMGQNVTLPCKYETKYNKPLEVCWGRGEIPYSKCNNQLLSTDGHKVIESTRVSSKYQLLGRLDEGDVSLTIFNLTQEDAGKYGCRAEIPGLLNDQKHHIDLIVEGEKWFRLSGFSTKSSSYRSGGFLLKLRLIS